MKYDHWTLKPPIHPQPQAKRNNSECKLLPWTKPHVNYSSVLCVHYVFSTLKKQSDVFYSKTDKLFWLQNLDWSPETHQWTSQEWCMQSMTQSRWYEGGYHPLVSKVNKMYPHVNLHPLSPSPSSRKSAAADELFSWIFEFSLPDLLILYPTVVCTS